MSVMKSDSQYEGAVRPAYRKRKLGKKGEKYHSKRGDRGGKGRSRVASSDSSNCSFL